MERRLHLVVRQVSISGNAFTQGLIHLLILHWISAGGYDVKP
jgi:hypothetical protein